MSVSLIGLPIKRMEAILENSLLLNIMNTS